MSSIPCPAGSCLHHDDEAGHCTCRPDNRIYRTAPADSTCECGSPAVGTVDTGRDAVPVCLVHAQIESGAGVEVTLAVDATAQARIDEALAHLERAAGRTFRRTATGELIESVGCILTGRKGAWWPTQSRRHVVADGRVLSLPPGVTE